MNYLLHQISRKHIRVIHLSPTASNFLLLWRHRSEQNVPSWVYSSSMCHLILVSLVQHLHDSPECELFLIKWNILRHNREEQFSGLLTSRTKANIFSRLTKHSLTSPYFLKISVTSSSVTSNRLPTYKRLFEENFFSVLPRGGRSNVGPPILESLSLIRS